MFWTRKQEKNDLLDFYVRNGFTFSCLPFLEQKIKPSQAALRDAIWFGHFDVVSEIRDYFPDIFIDIVKIRPLVEHVILNGDCMMIELLLEHGADVDRNIKIQLFKKFHISTICLLNYYQKLPIEEISKTLSVI